MIKTNSPDRSSALEFLSNSPMALTRIDCQIFRGPEATPDRSLYAVINPTREPGSLVVAGAIAARDNLGGQVASRLALEHFVESILNASSAAPTAVTATMQPTEAEDRCVSLIEGAFRSANTSVYEFGHKLAAGGRMAASLIGFYIRDRVIAAGRAGSVSAYLLRDGEVCPFFTDSEPGEKVTGYVGENSVVTVELSSIELRAHDVIIALPTILAQEQRAILTGYALRPRSEEGSPLAPLVESLYLNTEQVAFVLQAQVGPEVIYLNRIVDGGSAANNRPIQKTTDV